jgi:VanZ family protein
MTRLALGYAAGIFVFLMLADFGALRPVITFLAEYRHLDKVVHFFMYGSLALVVNVALAGRPNWSLPRAIATGSMIVLIASTLDEYSNLLVPQRGWSPADLAANYLGIALLGVLPCVCYAAQSVMRMGNTPQHEC